MQFTKIKLKMLSLRLVLFFTSLIFTACQPINSFNSLENSLNFKKKSKTYVTNKTNQTIGKQRAYFQKKLSESSLFQKAEILSKTTSFKKNYKKQKFVIHPPMKNKSDPIKKVKTFSLEILLGTELLKIPLILGKPDLVISFGKVKNYQYHFNNCFLDVYFVIKSKSFQLNDFALRAITLGSKVNKKSCLAEIKNALKS